MDCRNKPGGASKSKDMEWTDEGIILGSRRREGMRWWS
jgi:hypothetical protein